MHYFCTTAATATLCIVYEQSSEVQLQLLTATVKLFLKQPDDTQDMVQRVLKMATEDRYIPLYTLYSIYI
jgi:vesicle coat complex subunit